MQEKSTGAAQTPASQPPGNVGHTESLSGAADRRYEAVKQRAFQLFERDGSTHGNDVRHWLDAEQEIMSALPITMEDTAAQIVLHVEVPGFTASDLEVSVEPRQVTIRGKRLARHENKEGESPSVMESADEIFRTLELPSEVNATRVSATLKDGVLDIVLPKIETKKSANS